MRFMKRHLALAAVLASLAPTAVAAETNSHSMKMSHMSMAHMREAQQGCGELTLACATTVTPYFAPDGALWIAARAATGFSLRIPEIMAALSRMQFRSTAARRSLIGGQMPGRKSSSITPGS